MVLRRDDFESSCHGDDLPFMKIFVGAGNRREMDPSRLRVPVPEYLEIVVEDFVGFIEKFASNISKGGVFVGTDKPLAEGTALAILFRLEDDYTLIRGQGTVVWVRRTTLGPGREPGMGVRFDWLDDESQKLINKIVSNYIKEGGKPFRLESGSGEVEISPNSDPPSTATPGASAVAAQLAPSAAPTPAAPAPPVEATPEPASHRAPVQQVPPQEPVEAVPGAAASNQPQVQDLGTVVMAPDQIQEEVDRQMAAAEAEPVHLTPSPLKDVASRIEDELEGIDSVSAQAGLSPGFEGQSRATDSQECPVVATEVAPPKLSLTNTGSVKRGASAPERAQSPKEGAGASTAPPAISLSNTGTFRKGAAAEAEKAQAASPSQILPPADLQPATQVTPPSEVPPASQVMPPADVPPASQVVPPADVAPVSQVVPPVEPPPAEVVPPPPPTMPPTAPVPPPPEMPPADVQPALARDPTRRHDASFTNAD